MPPIRSKPAAPPSPAKQLAAFATSANEQRAQMAALAKQNSPAAIAADKQGRIDALRTALG
jgi:hypothetical protein